jgi:hypothetical protein
MGEKPRFIALVGVVLLAFVMALVEELCVWTKARLLQVADPKPHWNDHTHGQAGAGSNRVHHS